jgi:hypothetical protein
MDCRDPSLSNASVVRVVLSRIHSRWRSRLGINEAVAQRSARELPGYSTRSKWKMMKDLYRDG